MACDTSWFYDDALKFATIPASARRRFPSRRRSGLPAGRARALRVKAYRTPPSSTVSRETALMHGPVIGGMEVAQDFYAYTGGRLPARPRRLLRLRARSR